MARIGKTNTIGTGLGSGRPKVAVGRYDFAVDGGATGTITLRGDSLPSGAVITDSLIYIDTKPESGGSATIIAGSEAENDLQASKTVAEAPWSSTGAKRGAVTATGTPIVTTAERALTIKIGTAALTAGKFRVIVTYLELAA